MTAQHDQEMILRALARRIGGGETRYCTIPTIRKMTGLEVTSQYLLALADDLEAAGFVITRQMYQVSGGRLFQISAAGLDAVDRGEFPIRASSTTWTGRYDLSEQRKSEIRELLGQMRSAILLARLSNSRTANAIALIEAVEKLIETPDPLWPDIMRLLRSPTLASVTGIAGLVLAIVQVLMSAASS